MTAAAGAPGPADWVTLNASQRCDEARYFEQELFARVVAQDDAVLALSQLYQLYLAKLPLHGKPIGALLFLGPTGSGKTRSVEAAAEILFGDPYSMIKVDCAEFQHSHEISKLIGSPPGYLGHRETQPLLSQEHIDRFQTPSKKLTFVLFDEIEKASDALWQLLLGILDKATLTLGDNRRVDFSNCVIVMTSNLGAREMSLVTEGPLGFAPGVMAAQEINARLEKIGIEAARRKFSPEFMNRLDKVVVFNSLHEKAIRRILDLELEMVQRRILAAGRGPFVLRCSDDVKVFLLQEGYDRRYGARPLKRAIERYLIIPLSNLIATGQISAGDVLLVERDVMEDELRFSKARGMAAAVTGGAQRGVFPQPRALGL
ncbi:MAG: ATP-dependent Clp protease ATP-binding subunit [Blastocatellia bacterium]|nr:ATP-dependent Clp protease ATP-binding subunit [Blastocatellia bacterium]